MTRLILKGAPLDHAVEQVVMRRTYNSGQGSVGIKRVIAVGRERCEQMPAALKDRLAELLRQIREAAGAGAGGRIVHGGNRVDRPGFCLEPTIITDITDITDIAEDNPLYHEHAFGPVPSCYVVDSEDNSRFADASPSNSASASSSTASW